MFEIPVTPGLFDHDADIGGENWSTTAPSPTKPTEPQIPPYRAELAVHERPSALEATGAYRHSGHPAPAAAAAPAIVIG